MEESAKLVLGTSVFIVNVPILILIYTHRKLRKQKELVVIGFLCLADLSQAIAYIISGAIRQYFIYTERGTEMITNKECAHFIFPILFLYSYQLVGLGTLAVSIDRVLAVVAPFWYRKLTSKYSYRFVAANLLFTTVVCALFEFHVHTSPARTSSVMCYTDEAYTPEISDYILYFRMTAIALSILMYAPIVCRIYVLQRKRATKDTFSKQMLRTTRTVGLTSLAGFSLVVVPDLVLICNPYGLDEYKLICYLLQIVKSLLNIFLFTTRHDELRRVIRQTVASICGGRVVVFTSKTKPPVAATVMTTISSKKWNADFGNVRNVHQGSPADVGSEP